MVSLKETIKKTLFENTFPLKNLSRKVSFVLPLSGTVAERVLIDIFFGEILAGKIGNTVAERVLIGLSFGEITADKIGTTVAERVLIQHCFVYGVSHFLCSHDCIFCILHVMIA